MKKDTKIKELELEIKKLGLEIEKLKLEKEKGWFPAIPYSPPYNPQPINPVPSL